MNVVVLKNKNFFQGYANEGPSCKILMDDGVHDNPDHDGIIGGIRYWAPEVCHHTHHCLNLRMGASLSLCVQTRRAIAAPWRYSWIIESYPLRLRHLFGCIPEMFK